jgi:hypothetical protein
MNCYKVKARGFSENLVIAETRSKARHLAVSSLKELGYAKTYKDGLAQIEYVRREFQSQIKQQEQLIKQVTA